MLFHSYSYYVLRNVSDNHVLIYASNKYFGLVDVSQSRLEGSTRLGRKVEASSVITLTIDEIPVSWPQYSVDMKCALCFIT
jgi:hypothetical protein